MEETKVQENAQDKVSDTSEKQSLSVIEQARKEVEGMKEQLDRREAVVAREEAMAAEKMLSGSADAGQEPPKKKEPTDKEYADEVMSGKLNG